MENLSYKLRAWLAIVMLQAAGTIFLCYTTSKGSTHFTKPAWESSRIHAHSVAILLVIRSILMLYFESEPLHLCHILCSVLSALHTASEMLIFGSMKYGLANMSSIALNLLTGLIMLGSYNSLLDEQITAKHKKKKGRIFASHYMEGDLLDPPSNDAMVNELKKQK